MFQLGDFVHDVLPGSLGGGRVPGLPINPRQLQAECGRVLGFVLGGNEAVGFGLVAGLEGGLLLGHEVFAVKSPPAPAEYAETVLHVIIHVLSMNRPDPPALASSGRVKAV